ncbi:unnamed protein product [Schistosoma rodhaini]|uniref:Uncharacterized protein n=1 Tax=Schistosoma rodhaini TaxID=6188 RepID=A0AA85FJB9_9TREM|nr:unnamed protein product [Schistosoma rodhaini]CAH8520314.1 unnamed protein product [Schistosoma rodhaini]
MKINWKCPDWKTYTLDPPPLKEHVEKLAKLGLKDPWARNYAWQYLPKIYKTRPQLFREVLLARLPHDGLKADPVKQNINMSSRFVRLFNFRLN